MKYSAFCVNKNPKIETFKTKIRRHAAEKRNFTGEGGENLKYSMTKICISHDFHEEDVQQWQLTLLLYVYYGTTYTGQILSYLILNKAREIMTEISSRVTLKVVSFLSLIES